jgi:hypothetical protein
MDENSKKTYFLCCVTHCNIFEYALSVLSIIRLTNTIVEDPVIAKTVQTSAISRYHAADQRSGIALG